MVSAAVNPDAAVMPDKTRCNQSLDSVVTREQMGASSPLLAQAGQYNLIDPPQTTANPDKIEVLEYFWFGCPHCFAFEPAINEWAANKPDDVDFIRHAPPLNRGWTAHSEAFYSAEALGITDSMFDQLFNAIHREKKQLRDRKSISKWVKP